MKKQKPMTNEEFVANQGAKCPFCGSEQIEGGSIEVEGASATQEMFCNDCKEEHIVHFKLTGYSPA